MKKLTGLAQTFCVSKTWPLRWLLWPAAEDKALRGRNLSAVYRTLNRQVGQPSKRLPSCAQTWRVENQCDKSTPRIAQQQPLTKSATSKKSFPQAHHEVLTKQSNCLTIFPGQVQDFWDRSERDA